MELPQIKRKSLSDTTKEYLIKYILDANNRHVLKMPPEREIAEHLSVSRVTVRKALNDLESAGIILRIHGKGTFINPNATSISLSLNPGRDFFQIIFATGNESSSKLVRHRFIAADKFLSQKLSIPQGEKLLLIHKLFFANEVPAIFAADYIPLTYIGELNDEKSLSRSTFQLILEHSGTQCIRDAISIATYNRDEIDAATETAGLLTCDSGLVLESVNYDANNYPIFFCRVIYNTNVIHFNMVRSLDIDSY